MNIADLKDHSKVPELVAQVASLGPIQTVQSKTDPPDVQVQDGVLEDATGQVLLSVWEAHIGKFQVGDIVLLQNGWCRTITYADHPHRGDLQVSTGRYGKIVIVPPGRPEVTL